MQVNVGFAFNASEELQAANTYSATIKVFQVAGTVMSNDEPLDNVAISVPWSPASSSSLPGFSATCWFSAKSVVDGRVFVSRSDGAVLAVRRAPSDPRTFVLVGDGGSYALRLARGVEVSGVGDRELLTRVFSTRAWERALEPLELPGKGR